MKTLADVSNTFDYRSYDHFKVHSSEHNRIAKQMSNVIFSLVLSRLERAKKLQEQKEKEMLDKQQQQQQEIAAGEKQLLCQVLKTLIIWVKIHSLTAHLCVLFPVAAPIAAVAAAAAAATSNPALNVAALLASGTQVTPQIAMAAQMAALQAKTLAETGIAVPSYYNPSAVNPMKFAEQEKKRKMLWQGKKEGVRMDFAVIS